MKISLIASSVRPWLWDEFFASLNGNHDYEVVFSGNLSKFQVRPYLSKYPMLRYIHTADCICPAQCYEICRRDAIGNLIMWVADDCEFSPKLLDNICEFYHAQPIDVQIISVKTNENNLNNKLEEHTLLWLNVNTPQMAPLGVIGREYLNKIGGFNRRYSCGQYENDVVMRVYANGGKLVKYEDGCVNIEHLKKHGVGTKFWDSYNYDRKILENTWIVGGYKGARQTHAIVFDALKPPQEIVFDNRKVSMEPLLPFEPYQDKDLTTVSQCPISWPIVAQEMTLELSR